MEQKAVERKALLVGALIYSVMGISGWVAFYFSGSHALLLDGNYNLVNGIASIAGFLIVGIKDKRTPTFPFGQYVYESLYSLIKGILVLGILVAALWENIVKILEYMDDGVMTEIESKPIAIYTLLMVTLSFGLAAFYRSKNKGLGGQSSMLTTDTKTAVIDGVLTLVAGGGVLLALWLGRRIPGLEFLQYTGDSMIVLLFVIIAFREPFHIIRNNFIELAGGQIRSSDDRGMITRVIDSNRPKDIEIRDIYINKTGSAYLIGIFIETPGISSDALKSFREQITTELRSTFSNCQVEILLD